MTMLVQTFDEWVNVCMMQNVVKYLFPNIFQKIYHSLIQKLDYTFDLIALVGQKFDVDKKISGLIQKSYKHL